MKHIVLPALILLFSACSGMQVHKSNHSAALTIDKREPVAVAPFYNYTQTPMAGYSAASIATVLLRNHGFEAKNIAPQPQSDPVTDDAGQSLQQWIAEANKTGYRYLLSGEVTEWRYKAGIDAQPVVGLVINLLDTRTGKLLYSSSGSKDALPHDSIASAAQKLLDKMLP